MNKARVKEFRIFGMSFSKNWITLLSDFSLFVFFCSKTFLGHFALIELCSFAMFVGTVFLHALKSRQRLKLKGIAVWYLIFACLAAASCLWAMSPEFALKSLPSVLGLVVFIFALVYYVKSRLDFERVLILYLFANFLAAMMIILLFPFYEGIGPDRVTAITGVFFNTIAQTIAFSVIISVYFAIKKHNKWYLVPTITMIAATILAESRKAVLIPILGVLLIIVFKKKTRKETKVYFTAFTVLIVVVTLTVLLNNDFRKEMTDLFSSVFLGEATEDWSINLRSFFNDTAVSIWQQFPFAGAGLNNFAYYVQHYTWYDQARYAHNNYMELLSGLGIAGLFLYYSMYVYIVLKLLIGRFFKKSENTIDKALALSLMLTLLVFEQGIVTYSGVMYMIMTFVAYYVAVEGDKRLANEK